ncbi:putative membrane protein [Singulisphaera acidiphila DSM 18658]|uniref:Putative membrane protein n=2 Tax=Singulisphaera acidiphila TaxID=466153 RepID=L0DC95_SINAD|nr:putative membrane protein [Singulisphaera acidiphila DSM 18658]
MTNAEPPKRMLRVLLEDAKDFPATMLLGAAWVIVFVLMVATRLSAGPFPSLQAFLLGNIGGAHSFGDLSLNELYRGEIWRVVTCTFVHYNLLHLGMNLYGLYQLGSLVESWYGSGQFLAVYLVIGGGGNIVSALLRHARGMEPRMHSGGGSTVVLGLVALCAVMGWRSRSRIGDHLRSQMVGILVFTAILGQLHPMIDNWGHAGGALVGAVVGFLHRILIRTSDRPVGWWAGLLAAVVMILCGAAQWRDSRVEASYRPQVVAEEKRLKETEQLTFELFRLMGFYTQAVMRSELEQASFVPKSLLLVNQKPPRSPTVGASVLFNVPWATLRAEQARYQAILEAAAPTLGSPPTDDDYQRVCRLLARVLEQPPTKMMARGFQFHLTALIQRVSQDLLVIQGRRAALVRQAGLQ